MLFLTSIRPPFKGNKFSIQTETVQDGRGGDGVEDFAPVRWDKVCGYQGGGYLGSFGEGLEDAVGLFFGGDHIAQFIQTEDGDSRIELNQAVEVFGFGQFGIQVKEGEKNCLAAFKDGLMAQGCSDVSFAHSGWSDDHEVGRFFQPLGVEELQDFIPGDFGVEGPVEVFEEFDSFDAGLA